jgi:hypothetical protein
MIARGANATRARAAGFGMHLRRGTLAALCVRVMAGWEVDCDGGANSIVARMMCDEVATQRNRPWENSRGLFDFLSCGRLS